MYFDNTVHRTNWFQGILRWVFRLFGWKTEVIRPRTSSYVLIGAPHTSNWDFVIMLFLMAIESLPIRWMGKDSLFKGPVGPLMRSIGGIPVNRSERTKMVDQIAGLFAEHEDLIIGIAPEGTRSKTRHWKTGFYYIALKAQVPIVMGYIDYSRKTCGLGPSLMPCGDIDKDFEIIREFYSGIVGKHPRSQGEISLAPKA